MANSYRVVLSEDERASLRTLISRSTTPTRKVPLARILLKADHGEAGPGCTDAAIAGALEVNPSTVLRVRRQFTEQGLAATLDRKRPDRVHPRLLDGAAEARLIATACGTSSDDADHWSRRLLADELVRLEVVDMISHKTVRQTLKKTT